MSGKSGGPAPRRGSGTVFQRESDTVPRKGTVIVRIQKAVRKLNNHTHIPKKRGRVGGFLLFLNLILPLITYYLPVPPLPGCPHAAPESAVPGGVYRQAVSWEGPPLEHSFFAASCLIIPRDVQGSGDLSFSFTFTHLLPVRRIFPRRETLPSSLPFKPRVALILDDVGFVRAPVEAFFSIKTPLTVAVLPWGKYSQQHAEKAKNNGFEVILHLPLEPLDPANPPGPGTLSGDASPEEIRRQLRANIQNIPGIAGVNNHMGSKGTQDPALMRLVMEELKAKGLFFVDSFTIEGSVGLRTAREVGVPAAVRDLFLDHYGTEDIPRQMEKLLLTAMEKGSAIGILHPRQGAAEALAGFLPRFQEAGVEIVPVSELVE